MHTVGQDTPWSFCKEVTKETKENTFCNGIYPSLMVSPSPIVSPKSSKMSRVIEECSSADSGQEPQSLWAEKAAGTLAPSGHQKNYRQTPRMCSLTSAKIKHTEVKDQSLRKNVIMAL